MKGRKNSKASKAWKKSKDNTVVNLSTEAKYYMEEIFKEEYGISFKTDMRVIGLVSTWRDKIIYPKELSRDEGLPEAFIVCHNMKGDNKVKATIYGRYLADDGKSFVNTSEFINLSSKGDFPSLNKLVSTMAVIFKEKLGCKNLDVEQEDVLEDDVKAEVAVALENIASGDSESNIDYDESAMLFKNLAESYNSEKSKNGDTSEDIKEGSKKITETLLRERGAFVEKIYSILEESVTESIPSGTKFDEMGEDEKAQVKDEFFKVDESLHDIADCKKAHLLEKAKSSGEKGNLEEYLEESLDDVLYRIRKSSKVKIDNEKRVLMLCPIYSSRLENLLFFLARGMLKAKYDEETWETFFLETTDKAVFTIIWTEEVYRFLICSLIGTTRNMKLVKEELYTFAELLEYNGEKYGISEWRNMAKTILFTESIKNHILEFSSALKAKLEEVGISCSENTSVSTNSTYIKLDDGRLGQVRISDHDVSRDVNYNVILYSARSNMHSDLKVGSSGIRKIVWNIKKQDEEYALEDLASKIIYDKRKLMDRMAEDAYLNKPKNR